jgi:sigma-B regulation protein RsbU (phosphoserine phosphatase)
VVLDLAIEAVGADRGILLTKEGEGLLVQASRGDNFRISSTIRDRVLEERSSLLLEDVLQDETFRAVESIVAQHVLSLMAVPLQTDERVLGMIYVDSVHPGRHFSREDLELLTIMANVAAIRIERQRLIEIEAAQRRMDGELEQAAEIQRQFLPARAPEVPGLELSGYNVSCRAVGGDYYDYLLYPDGRVGVLIGDVCGKGLPAALLMMSFQSRVQVLAEESHSPAELAGRLNRVLTANQLGYRFISFFFCFIHPETGRLLYTNAGHNPPILLHASGEVERLDRGGPVLGILSGAGYEEGTCQLDPLDLLLLYSDGITEANNPEEVEFGDGRLLTILRQNCHLSAEEISSRIIDEVQAWMGGTHTLDDITVVLVRRSGPS